MTVESWTMSKYRESRKAENFRQMHDTQVCHGVLLGVPSIHKISLKLSKNNIILVFVTLNCAAKLFILYQCPASSKKLRNTVWDSNLLLRQCKFLGRKLIMCRDLFLGSPKFKNRLINYVHKNCLSFLSIKKQIICFYTVQMIFQKCANMVERVYTLSSFGLFSHLGDHSRKKFEFTDG